MSMVNYGLLVAKSLIISGCVEVNVILFKLTANDPLEPVLEEVNATVGVLVVCCEKDFETLFIVGEITLNV